MRNVLLRYFGVQEIKQNTVQMTALFISTNLNSSRVWPFCPTTLIEIFPVILIWTAASRGHRFKLWFLDDTRRRPGLSGRSFLGTRAWDGPTDESLSSV